MKILGIDSSGLVAGVAIEEDGRLISEYMIRNKLTHSQTLLPMIDEMMTTSKTPKEEIEAIAISEGPGSFTGLRIGAATAKGLAYGLGIPVIPVSSLLGLAFNLRLAGGVVCSIMDARRSEVYYGVYEYPETIPQKLCDEGAAPIADLLEKLSGLNKRVIFVGDGVPVFCDTIREKMGAMAQFAPEELRYQKASSIALIAEVLANEGACEPDKFAPKYLRVSQAERERAEKESQLAKS